MSDREPPVTPPRYTREAGKKSAMHSYVASSIGPENTPKYGTNNFLL